MLVFILNHVFFFIMYLQFTFIGVIKMLAFYLFGLGGLRKKDLGDFVV